MIARLDQLMGGVLRNRLHRLESRFFKKIHRFHPLSLFSPEEDEFLLIHAFSSSNLTYSFPFEELGWINHLDQAARPEDRERIMKFYKDCIKRQAYFKRSDRHFLSKNPIFSTRIDSLYAHFPGCKFIYMVRNPLDVVPSMLSLTHERLQLYSTINVMKAGYPHRDQVYQTAKLFYKYPLARLQGAPKNSYTIVNYEDLILRPSKVIQTVYQNLGLELTSKYLEILRDEEAKVTDFESGHVYSIDQFQLTREQIVSDFRNIFERFGFDTREQIVQQAKKKA